MPAAVITPLRDLETGGFGVVRSTTGLRPGLAEAEGERGRPVAAFAGHPGDPSRLYDVAGSRLLTVLVEPVVVLQVGPAVVLAEEPVGRPPERRLRHQRGGDVAVGSDQRIANRPAGVVHPAVRERGVVQSEEPVAAAVQRPQADPDHERIAPRIGDDPLRDPVLARLRGVDLREPQAAYVGPDRAVPHVRGLAVGERRPVGDDQLEVAHARRGEVGIEHLARPSLLKGEPDVASPGARRTEPGLVAFGPDCLVPRPGLDLRGRLASWEDTGARQHRAGDGGGKGDDPRQRSDSLVRSVSGHPGPVPGGFRHKRGSSRTRM